MHRVLIASLLIAGCAPPWEHVRSDAWSSHSSWGGSVHYQFPGNRSPETFDVTSDGYTFHVEHVAYVDRSAEGSPLVVWLAVGRLAESASSPPTASSDSNASVDDEQLMRATRTTIEHLEHFARLERLERGTIGGLPGVEAEAIYRTFSSQAEFSYWVAAGDKTFCALITGYAPGARSYGRAIQQRLARSVVIDDPRTARRGIAVAAAAQVIHSMHLFGGDR
jgi:hypothetical protein